MIKIFMKKENIHNTSNQNQLPIKELPIVNNSNDLKTSSNIENEKLNKINNKDNNENIIENGMLNLEKNYFVIKRMFL